VSRHLFPSITFYIDTYHCCTAATLYLHTYTFSLSLSVHLSFFITSFFYIFFCFSFFLPFYSLTCIYLHTPYKLSPSISYAATVTLYFIEEHSVAWLHLLARLLVGGVLSRRRTLPRSLFLWIFYFVIWNETNGRSLSATWSREATLTKSWNFYDKWMIVLPTVFLCTLILWFID